MCVENPPRPVEVLGRLRSETRPRHEALEEVVWLFEPGLTVAGYHRYLAALHRVYRPAEEALRAVGALPAILPDLDERWKVPTLEADLRALGGMLDEPPSLEPAHRRPVSGWQPPRDAASALGCLYVFEGATLGGRLLRRHLAETLALPDGRGLDFFGIYGERIGERWQAFRGCLGGWVGEEEARADAVIAAADQTFEALLQVVTAASVREAG